MQGGASTGQLSQTARPVGQRHHPCRGTVSVNLEVTAAGTYTNTATLTPSAGGTPSRARPGVIPSPSGRQHRQERSQRENIAGTTTKLHHHDGNAGPKHLDEGASRTACRPTSTSAIRSRAACKVTSTANRTDGRHRSRTASAYPAGATVSVVVIEVTAAGAYTSTAADPQRGWDPVTGHGHGRDAPPKWAPASPERSQREHHRGHDDELHDHDGQRRRPSTLTGKFTDSLPVAGQRRQITSSVQVQPARPT